MTTANFKSKFYRGSATYKCIVCGKLTRDTGRDERQAYMCAKCYEEAGLENEHSDGYHTPRSMTAT